MTTSPRKKAAKEIIIDDQFCKGCNLLRRGLPATEVFSGSQQAKPAPGTPMPQATDPGKCSVCFLCEMTCPDLAITVIEESAMRREVRIAGLWRPRGRDPWGRSWAVAAGIHENLEVAQSQSYGPEARGGACRSDVVISDEPIDYTKPLALDVFVALSPAAAEKYWPEVQEGKTLVLVDKTLVPRTPIMRPRAGHRGHPDRGGRTQRPPRRQHDHAGGHGRGNRLGKPEGAGRDFKRADVR